MPQAESAMSWEQCLAFVLETFNSDDSSRIHARLRLEIRDAVHPAMVWHGKSTADSSNEVVHIASPIAAADTSDLASLAREADEFPFGSLRIMNGLVHIHQALPLSHVTPEHLATCIRLITAEALALSQET